MSPSGQECFVLDFSAAAIEAAPVIPRRVRRVRPAVHANDILIAPRLLRENQKGRAV
jgi:hypothetical protein